MYADDDRECLACLTYGVCHDVREYYTAQRIILREAGHKFCIDREGYDWKSYAKLPVIERIRCFHYWFDPYLPEAYIGMFGDGI